MQSKTRNVSIGHSYTAMDTDLPTFPPLSKNLKFSDGWTRANLNASPLRVGV